MAVTWRLHGGYTLTLTLTLIPRCAVARDRDLHQLGLQSLRSLPQTAMLELLQDSCRVKKARLEPYQEGDARAAAGRLPRELSRLDPY